MQASQLTTTGSSVSFTDSNGSTSCSTIHRLLVQTAGGTAYSTQLFSQSSVDRTSQFLTDCCKNFLRDRLPGCCLPASQPASQPDLYYYLLFTLLYNVLLTHIARQAELQSLSLSLLLLLLLQSVFLLPPSLFPPVRRSPLSHVVEIHAGRVLCAFAFLLTASLSRSSSPVSSAISAR